MTVTHTLDVAALCPADHLPDRYRCVVRSSVVIPVERILEAAAEYASREIYQEELCQALHRRLNASVTLVGFHSGVRTEVTCGDF